jgi:hypothetical protein
VTRRLIVSVRGAQWRVTLLSHAPVRPFHL